MPQWIVALAIALLFGGVVLWGFVKPIGEKASDISAMSPSVDALCIASSVNLQSTQQKVDDDNDGRDDYTCDTCVCKSPICNNNLREKGGADSDGDYLPDICDAAPNDKTNYDFNNQTCPQDKLLPLQKPWGKQCRPNPASLT